MNSASNSYNTVRVPDPDQVVVISSTAKAQTLAAIQARVKDIARRPDQPPSWSI